MDGLFDSAKERMKHPSRSLRPLDHPASDLCPVFVFAQLKNLQNSNCEFQSHALTRRASRLPQESI